MALIAWLLNDDLNNYGIGAVTVTNHGATLDNTCKTGKGYNFASNTYIDATIPIITGNFTVAWWEYSINFNNGTMPWGIQMFNPFYSKCLNTGDGEDNPWYKPGTTTAIDNLSNSIWHHFAVTGNGSVNYLYIDGSLYGQSKIYKKLNSTALRFNGWPYDTKYKRNGKLCDWRLYNTCLSAEEIKEISRGMVLHYKMCQPERSENLLANGAATEITCRSKNPDYPLKAIRTTLENNTQYTLSFDAKSDNGLGTFYCSLANGGSSQIYFATKIKPTTKYKHFVYTVTRGTQITNNILFAAYYGWSENANVTDTIHIKNVKLEKGSNPNATFSPPPTEVLNWGTIEYDGSGYKNHGTVSGNVTLSADSPRYTGSYSLADGKYITAPGLTYINSGSISFWAKINTLASNGWLPFTGPTKSHYIMASTGGTGSFYHNAAGEETKTIYEDGKVITAPSSIGVWHHYVITNVDLTTWTKFILNNYESNWNAELQMSDVRVYSTTLDATAIAELYKLGRN